MSNEKFELPLVALQHLAAALKQLQIPFAIIGGVAVSVVSVPRYTRDIDAVILHSETDVTDLVSRLEEFGLRSIVADPHTFARKNRMVVLRDSEGTTIDLSLAALPFEVETIDGATQIEVAPGLTLPIASPEALVIMKSIASRPKDLEDIRQLLAMNPGIDREKVWITVKEFAEILEHPDIVEQLERLFDE